MSTVVDINAYRARLDRCVHVWKTTLVHGEPQIYCVACSASRHPWWGLKNMFAIRKNAK